MTAHPHNALFRALKKMAQVPIPTWAQYQASSEDEQERIRETWCAVAHRYRGNGSQAVEAMQLYIRAVSQLRRAGKIKIVPHGPARPMSDDEEYPGEAEDRGLTPGGFNVTE